MRDLGDLGDLNSRNDKWGRGKLEKQELQTEDHNASLSQLQHSTSRILS